MAIEDIPPRRRGLGERLEDILSRMSETVGAPEEERLGYEDYLFGGAGTATTEQVESALENVTEQIELPPPTEIKFIEEVNDGSRRPDKKPSNYGQGSEFSTRVRAFQFIPVSVDQNGNAIGDLIVAFARHRSGQAQPMYTYSNRTFGDYKLLETSGSLGRTIGQSSTHPKGPNGITARGDYIRGTKSEAYYRSLHPEFSGEILSEE